MNKGFLQLEDPAEPLAFQTDGITFTVDAIVVDLIAGQHIFAENGELYIERTNRHNKANSFHVSQRTVRQRLAVFIWETLDTEARTINIHRQRIVFADDNQYNFQMSNMRVERLPEEKLPARRQVA